VPLHLLLHLHPDVPLHLLLHLHPDVPLHLLLHLHPDVPLHLLLHLHQRLHALRSQYQHQPTEQQNLYKKLSARQV